MIGYDYLGCDGMIGGATGFAHAGIDQKENAGNDTDDLFLAALYGTWYYRDAYIDLSLLGSYVHFNTERKVSFPGFSAKARATHGGGQLLPHLGLGYDWTWSPCDKPLLILEPFVALDWAVLFERGYKERKAAPLDMKIDSRNSSILRSEVGLHFYQEWDQECGIWILKETLGYINKQPFNVGAMSAAIVGAPGSFSVVSFTENQNLFTPGIEIFYRSLSKNDMISLSWDGEFFSGYCSNEIQLRIGKYF